MRWALLSVHDKTGLADFGRRLTERGFGLLASGGTAATLRAASLEVLEVGDYAQSPEILQGRVKTLHPRVHGGILSRESDADRADLQRIGARPIDLVAVSLYPFREALRAGAVPEQLIEEIDIGGVALLRAAAKNCARVWVVPGPAHYDAAIDGIDRDDAAMRRRLAAAAFTLTASYDAAIAGHFSDTGWPAAPFADLRLAGELRYGENPHQQAALYTGGPDGVAQAQKLQGKQLSYNNLLDADAAWRLAADLPEASVSVIKHQTPAGAASLGAVGASLSAAVAADEEASFGGVIAIHGTLDREAATFLAARFFELVLAEDVAPEALPVLAQRPNMRVLRLGAQTAGGFEGRTLAGGLLLQSADRALEPVADWRLVAGPRQDARCEDLDFAWRVAKHARSNAIVAARDGRTIGIGCGQVSRVRAARQALEMAGDAARGAVLASDGFLPFADVVELAAEHGIAAIVEPGGSRRDADSITVAQRLGVALYFTGARHFRH